MKMVMTVAIESCGQISVSLNETCPIATRESLEEMSPRATILVVCVLFLQNRYHEGWVYHPAEGELGSAFLCNSDCSDYLLPETKLTASFWSKFLKHFSYLYVYMCKNVYAWLYVWVWVWELPQHSCGGQRKTWGNRFSSHWFVRSRD